jgi:hypothetical protein
MTILAFLLVACFIWAVVSSVAAQEWREIALTLEDELAAVSDADRSEQ